MKVACAISTSKINQNQENDCSNNEPSTSSVRESLTTLSLSDQDLTKK